MIASDAVCISTDLTKTYANGITANDCINLQFYQGEIFGLLGPNGAGKTTFLKQMVGLLRPTSGTIRLFQQDIVSNPEIIPGYLAYLPQTLRTVRSHNVQEAIYFTGLLRGLDRSEARQQTDDLLHLLGLDPVQKQTVSKISGGQKQLVTLASTLIGYRPLIVLDEPTNNLDPANRRNVWTVLKHLQDKYKITILLVTHNVLEAEQILSRVALIDKGRVIAHGTPHELSERVASKARIEIRFKDKTQTLTLADFEVEALPNDVWRIYTRTHQVPDAMRQLMAQVDIQSVEDFQLIPPSLEDVYITLTGVQEGIH